MTGYGRGMRIYNQKTIIVEIRALNAKISDTRFKMPINYREREMDLRRKSSEALERGKVDVSFMVKIGDSTDATMINHSLFKRYYAELEQLQKELKIQNSGDLMQTIVRLPHIVADEEESVTNEEWIVASAAFDDAMKDFMAFRKQEGDAMANDLSSRASNILNYLELVKPFEQERITRLRARLQQNLEEHFKAENLDNNRFEQEILYYLEKMDVTEEKVRLSQHCKYFDETLKETKNVSKGKTLNFIAQEIGREVNTLGSKAYSADIQHLVVKMKDELEKIKEMVANVV